MDLRLSSWNVSVVSEPLIERSCKKIVNSLIGDAGQRNRPAKLHTTAP